MAEVQLYCPEPLGLKLGPSTVPSEQIVFRDGFVTFDAKTFPDWEAWVKHPGTPYIEVLPADSQQVAAGTANAFVCPICQREFKTKLALGGHLRSHAPKKGK